MGRVSSPCSLKLGTNIVTIAIDIMCGEKTYVDVVTLVAGLGLIDRVPGSQSN